MWTDAATVMPFLKRLVRVNCVRCSCNRGPSFPWPVSQEYLESGLSTGVFCCGASSVTVIEYRGNIAVYRYLRAFAKLQKANISAVLSVRPAGRMEQLGPIGRIFIKFYI